MAAAVAVVVVEDLPLTLTTPSDDDDDDADDEDDEMVVEVVVVVDEGMVNDEATVVGRMVVSFTLPLLASRVVGPITGRDDGEGDVSA